MNRFLLAVFLFAAPAFAQGWDPGYGDEGYGAQTGDSYRGDWDGPGYADGGPTLDDFRGDSELSWNGEWIDTADYGTVWRPRHVSDDWQPYLYGRWVWTDAGWGWSSDEPFGWAVYHYGRWAFSPAMGWMWLPGSVWAPAWVSWRWTDGYAAWCPLGPRYVVYQPALWVVVPSRQFLEPVRHYAVPLRQRPSLPLPVRTAPRAGPPLAAVERATGRSVRPVVFQPQPHVSHAQPATQRTQGVPRATPRPTWPAASPTPAPQGGPRATPRPTWYGAAPAQPRQQPAPRSAPAPHAVAPRASTP